MIVESHCKYIPSNSKFLSKLVSNGCNNLTTNLWTHVCCNNLEWSLRTDSTNKRHRSSASSTGSLGITLALQCILSYSNSLVIFHEFHYNYTRWSSRTNDQYFNYLYATCFLHTNCSLIRATFRHVQIEKVWITEDVLNIYNYSKSKQKTGFGDCL